MCPIVISIVMMSSIRCSGIDSRYRCCSTVRLLGRTSHPESLLEPLEEVAWLGALNTLTGRTWMASAGNRGLSKTKAALVQNLMMSGRITGLNNWMSCGSKNDEL